MTLQALVRHLLEYRSCRVGSVVQLKVLPSAETSCPEWSMERGKKVQMSSLISPSKHFMTTKVRGTSH